MRRLIMGCGVAALVALTAKTEAKLPAFFSRLSPPDSSSAAAVPAELPLSRLPRGELGLASWYGEESNGVTASGEVFDKQDLTAAHRTLPIGSKIMVTNLRNNKSLVLRVNDRGPNVTGRLLDVSQAAAERLGFVDSGRTPVRVRILSVPKKYLAWLHQSPTPRVAHRE